MESMSSETIMNALVADYLCSVAPKIGQKFKVRVLFSRKIVNWFLFTTF